MYPDLIQFEARKRQFEEELALRLARAIPPNKSRRRTAAVIDVPADTVPIRQTETGRQPFAVTEGDDQALGLGLR